mgnify:CR=1 FL=1
MNDNESSNGIKIGNVAESKKQFPPSSQIPKRAYDKEYHTQYWNEVKYLKDNGIEPVYVRIHPVYGVKTYKYTKTSKLFGLLTDFYRTDTHESRMFFNVKETK